MKIIHRYKLGIPIQCDKKCGDVLSSVISTGGSIYSTEATNAASWDMLESNQNFQREMFQRQNDVNTRNAEIARNFSRELMQNSQAYNTSEREAQQAYQTQMTKDSIGLQMQGAREAGLNPNVLFGSGATASGSSATSGPGVSMPGSPVAQGAAGISPVSFQPASFMDAFAKAAQGISSLANAKKSGMDVNMIQQQIENLQIDAEYKNCLKASVQLKNSVDKLHLKYEERKIVQDIEEQSLRMANIKSDTERIHVATKVQQSLDRLQNTLADKHGQEIDVLKIDLANLQKQYDNLFKLQGAQVKEANAKAYEAGQHAKLLGLESSGQEFKNAVLKVDSEISAATAQQKLHQVSQELRRQSSIAEKDKIRAQAEIEKLDKILKSYREHPNKAALDAALDNFNEHFPVLGGFIKAFSK